MVEPLIQQQPPEYQPNGHNDPNLQLSISRSKLDHISELLEATKKMMRYFKKSYESNNPHITNDYNNFTHTTHNSSLHLDKHTCKTHNPNDQVNKITGQT